MLQLARRFFFAVQSLPALGHIPHMCIGIGRHAAISPPIFFRCPFASSPEPYSAHVLRHRAPRCNSPADFLAVHSLPALGHIPHMCIGIGRHAAISPPIFFAVHSLPALGHIPHTCIGIGRHAAISPPISFCRCPLASSPGPYSAHVQRHRAPRCNEPAGLFAISPLPAPDTPPTDTKLKH